MKKLSRNEMKNVFGGDEAISEIGGAGCNAACVASNGQSSGTCSSTSITVSGVTFSGCECSISGGRGC